MEQLTDVIFMKAQPKELGNSIITGPMLAALTKAYVEAINKGAVPTISTAWQVIWPARQLTYHPSHTCLIMSD